MCLSSFLETKSQISKPSPDYISNPRRVRKQNKRKHNKVAGEGCIKQRQALLCCNHHPRIWKKKKTLVRIVYSNWTAVKTVTCKVHNITVTAKYLVEQTELY